MFLQATDAEVNFCVSGALFYKQAQFYEEVFVPYLVSMCFAWYIPVMVIWGALPHCKKFKAGLYSRQAFVQSYVYEYVG